MINVSKEFQKLMNERTDFKQYAEMTLADGTEIVLTKEDFSIQNNSVVDGAETSGIPLGVAVCRYIQIEIDNRDERYSDIDFFGAKIRLYLTFELSETEEKIEYGTFTVRKPETYGETIVINALDDMHKADKVYSTNLVFPATIRNILVDACDTLDISLGSTSFLNDSFTVQDKPTDITFRQLFGYIAMIAGGNIRIDTTGRLRVLTYDFSVIEDIQNRIDGGAYLNWTNPSWVDGGNFTDYSSGDDIDGGTYDSVNGYHILSNWKDGLTIDTDDVVITGISTTKENEEGDAEELIYGVDGYVLKIENPLIVGQEQAALELIGAVMVGGKMRKFSGDLIANPTCEFMDVAAVTDRKGNVYATVLTDINFQFFGFTTLSNSAAPAMRNSSQTYSAAVETLIAAKKLVEKEKTAREKAVEQLAQDLQTSSGLFMTQEKQTDGSIIYYMHDKPTLNESMIVWKLTALAFGISTDGGKTYPYGFTVNGEVITRLLYAEGIDADYINTGVISSKDGSCKIDIDKGTIHIKSNKFSWDSTYSSLTSDGKLVAKDVDLTGTITANSGKIANFTISEKSFYSGEKSSLTSSKAGVYIGTDGISIGTGSSGPAFKVTSSGDVVVGLTSTLNLGGDIVFDTTSPDIKISTTEMMIFRKLTNATYVQSSQEFRIASGKNLVLGGDIKLSATSSNITDTSSNTLVKYEINKVSILSSSTILGKSGGSLSFFGDTTPVSKQTVAKIATTSSATASDVATKINALIDALKAYNLIG